MTNSIQTGVVPSTADFSKVSWPTRKNEEFHFTPLNALGNEKWHTADIDLKKLDQIIGSYIADNEYHIVFGNGRLIQERTKLPPGLRLITCDPSGCKSCEACDDTCSKPQVEPDFLLELNCLFSEEKWLLDIKDRTTLSAMKIVFATAGDQVRAHPHLKIRVGSHSQVKLMELHVGEGAYLSNPALVVECASHANCTYAKVQNESSEATHLGLIRGHVQQSAELNGFMLATTGGKLARYDARVKLLGERARVELHGLQTIYGPHTADFTSVIEHKAVHCTSRQSVKNVLENKGKGIFQGKVLIDPGAQKSDGYQMNQALFLDNTCTMDSKPELEIYADDVKCSHGCTVGALDQDKMFYLRARGIPEKQARLMLIDAFIVDALDEIPKQELKNWVKKFVQYFKTEED